MTNKTKTTAAATHAAATEAHVQASNAANVVVYCAPVNNKKGASRTRFASLTVGRTLGDCRASAHGFTAADVRWGMPRGHLLHTTPGSALHKAWEAATAKGAKPAAKAKFVELANAAMAEQHSIGTMPTITDAQPAGTSPA